MSAKNDKGRTRNDYDPSIWDRIEKVLFILTAAGMAYCLAVLALPQFHWLDPTLRYAVPVTVTCIILGFIISHK